MFFDEARNRAIGALWLSALLIITLLPGSAEDRARGSIAWLCLVCGSRGTADAILNVFLFVPLGALGAAWGWSVRRLLALALALSAGVEALQTLLPGRHPTLGDVWWNVAGALVGAYAHRAIVHRLEARPAEVTDRSLVLAGVVSLLIVASGVLTWPHRPAGERYWAQWTPTLGSFRRYDGTVLAATLNERPFPRSWFPSGRDARSELSGDWRVRASITAGRDLDDIAPILTVYDARQREVLLLGVIGADLVMRELLLARMAGLDQPDVRLTDAFAGVPPGDTVEVGITRRRNDVCLTGPAGERCRLGTSLGRTWGLLLYPEGIGEPVRRALDAAWLFVLLFPVGFFATTVERVLRCGTLIAGSALITVLGTGLTLGSLPTALVGLLGLIAGFATVERLTHRDGRVSPGPP